MSFQRTLQACVFAGATLLSGAQAAEQPKKNPFSPDDVLVKKLGDDSFFVREKAQKILNERIQEQIARNDVLSQHAAALSVYPLSTAALGVAYRASEQNLRALCASLYAGTQSGDLERALRAERVLSSPALVKHMESLTPPSVHTPEWFYDVWIDELPKDHPDRVTVYNVYLAKARKVVGDGSIKDSWKDYRYATKLLLDDLVREAYLTGHVPRCLEYLHPDRTDMRLTGQKDMEEVFQPLYLGMLKGYVCTTDRNPALKYSSAFPKALIEKTRKQIKEERGY